MPHAFKEECGVPYLASLRKDGYLVRVSDGVFGLLDVSHGEAKAGPSGPELRWSVGTSPCIFAWGS